MINHHPTEALLIGHAEGTLPAGIDIMVAAHLDMCEHCREHLADIESVVAESELELSPASPLPPGYGHMLSDILELPKSDIAPVKAQTMLELDGRQFRVPRALSRFVDKRANWSHAVGKLWQAPVDIGNDLRAHFIYIDKNGGVPEHTHKGSEMTLVLNGEFSDGMDHYKSGDFIMLDGSHTHAPQTGGDEGCLVFSILDQPLHFTSGVARLLNPFSHLFF